ncbi:MAG: AAA domain-containing protein, partial [Hyphomicrobiaceae bacterium]|nr:AAA domain-containing protein [Hyphomicrobiaceae bacterium]
SRHVNHFKSDFDVMIIDEASKTTFQEFLVPAIHANRWIIVGDTMQLSPYANTEDVSVVVKNMFEKYDQKILNMLAPKKQNWNQDIGYRLKLEYEQAIVTKNNPLDSKYVKQIERRAPAGYKDLMLKTARSILSVAFPSIMELLLHGNICEPDSSHTKSIFVGGIPSGLIERRRVLLKYQFRMHPDIAEFAKDCFYEGQALNSMQNFENKRKLDYGLFEKRLCWIKVPHILNDEENHEEIDQIFLQLEHFHELDLKKEKNKKWEIGILSFYSNQNMAIQERLSEVTKYSGMEITNGTVDSFQGKEFDIVLVSFSKSNPTQFLNSPNRLNVAITRARYLCILVGNPELLSLAKKRYGENSPLGQLDKIEKYDGMAGYDDLFKNGRLAAEAKKFEVATGWLDRALDKRPGDPDALYRKGLLLVERGLHAEALRCFDSCPKKDGRTLHGKGAILAKLGYHRRAISYYDRALEINPDAANVQTSKDASLADLKKHGREWCKRGDLHKMEAAGPDPTLLLHGRLTSAAMDGKKAMAWCERALGANPDDASALYDKGCLLAWDEIRAGSFATPPGAGYAASPDDSREDALACFDRVLDLAPRDLHAQHNRGALLVMLDRHEEALACFEKVLEAEPDDRPALFCKGYVLDRLGRGGDAVKHFDRVLETLPSHPDVLAKKGHALAWLGRYEEALGCFERLRMAHPDKPLHRLHMTIMLVEMDRIREAIECIGDES